MFFVTIPHCGELIPPEAHWLQDCSDETLGTDVDTFTDDLWTPVLEKLKIPYICAKWHRYVVDLNRLTTEIDEDAVVGVSVPSGTYPKGLHWIKTTKEVSLITVPLTQEVHELILQKYYQPFHDEIVSQLELLKKPTYHLDMHSMPSKGRAMHKDEGKIRPDIVIADRSGESAESAFVDTIVKSFENVGLSVVKNWPYQGGGIVKKYGRPDQGRHSVVIEVNRALYMDEETREKIPDKFNQLSQRLHQALTDIIAQISER